MSDSSFEQVENLFKVPGVNTYRLFGAAVKAFALPTWPESFCHYTDFNGLNGILGSHSLWATHSRTLNDGSEQLYGLNVVRAFMKEQLAGSMDKLVDPFLGEPSRMFVTCFCERSDILSMWRGYASHGGGYCLEFDPSGLLGFHSGSGTSTAFHKLFYGNRLSASFSDLLSEVCHLLQNEPSSSALCHVMAHTVAMTLKHEAFRDESEWRLIIRDPPPADMNFRAGHSTIRPYVPLESEGGLPLKRIVIGPTLRQDDALSDAVGLMLDRYGYKDVKIQWCDIPYQL